MDFGEILPVHCIRWTDKIVDHKYKNLQNGFVQEHIFTNICVVRWNSKEQTIEYITDLKEQTNAKGSN